MGEFIGACSRARDGLERARNESRRFAVTLDGEKHLPSFACRTFMSPSCVVTEIIWLSMLTYCGRQATRLLTCPRKHSGGVSGSVSRSTDLQPNDTILYNIYSLTMYDESRQIV